MAKNPPSVSGEDRLIARYFRPLARHPGAFGLMDDAAALSPPDGADLVMTADAIVADIHFLSDDPPDSVARKALRVNLSDLAAKGADAAGFLLSLALPDDVADAWLTDFAKGLGEDADTYSCPLLGGDTVRRKGPVLVSIAAFGFVPRGKMVARQGAKPGDQVIVTGTIGDAALGLRLRQDSVAAKGWQLTPAAADHLVSRYRLPQPRSTLARAVRDHASAAMDVSDGLAGDLAKLCLASAVSADVKISRVPLSPVAQQAIAAEPQAIETVLSGGDDYEIVAAVAPDKAGSFLRACAMAGVAAAVIGEIVEGNETPRFLREDGSVMNLARLSFSHF